jgi:neogenin
MIRLVGTGPQTEWLFAETYENDLDESEVPAAPAWIRCRPGANSIHVTWNSPAHQEIRVRGYILGWGKGIPDDETVQLEENIRSYEIKNLEPNSEYVLSLRARNLKGDGQPIYDTTRTRDDLPIEAPTPLETPLGLRAISLSATSIVIYWSDSTLKGSQHVTDNRFYVVRYSHSGSTKFKYHNTTDLNCMIGDLKPNTKYEFAVKTVKGMS